MTSIDSSHRPNSRRAAALLAGVLGILAGLSIAGPVSASAEHEPAPCTGYSPCEGEPLMSIVCGSLRPGASHPSDGSNIIVHVDDVRLTALHDEHLLDLAAQLATSGCRASADDSEPADHQAIVVHHCGGGSIAVPRPCIG